MSRKRKNNYGKYQSQSDKNPSNGQTSDTTSSTTEADKTTSPSTTNKQTGNSSSRESAAPVAKGNNARTAGNDPEWYSKDAQMLIDAGSLPFSECLGDPINLLQIGETITQGANGRDPWVFDDDPDERSIAGILTLKTKSSFGYNSLITDPINVAANALYAHTRYVNSGRKNYDATDEFIYCASMADVYSFVIWCERVYSKAYLYSQRNKYIGETLLKAENINAKNIVANLANFRYWINTFINKVAAFAVPASISYFQRRAWIYAHIYLENPDANIKDQLYEFSPDGFYRFNLDSAGLGMLQYETIAEIVGHTNELTIEDFVTIGNWLMSNITGDEDFGLISGDILKAFEQNIIGIPSLPEEVSIVPVYDEYVLLQIKNAQMVQIYRGTTMQPDNGAGITKFSNNVVTLPGNVYQSPDGVLWSPEATAGVTTTTNLTSPWDRSALMLHAKKVLTVNTPTPTPVDVIEITRLLPASKGLIEGSEAGAYFNVIGCGADIVVECDVTYYGRDGDDKWVALKKDYTTSGNTITAIKDLIHYLKFKYAPMIFRVKSDDYRVEEVELISEVDNYTIATNQVINKLHEVSLLSMFWVPGVAKLMNF